MDIRARRPTMKASVAARSQVQWNRLMRTRPSLVTGHYLGYNAFGTRRQDLPFLYFEELMELPMRRRAPWRAELLDSSK